MTAFGRRSLLVLDGWWAGATGSRDILINIHPGHVDVPSCRIDLEPSGAAQRGAGYRGIENTAVLLSVTSIPAQHAPVHL